MRCYWKLLNIELAERVGFEPTVRLSTYTRFPGVRLKPLIHLSGMAILTDCDCFPASRYQRAPPASIYRYIFAAINNASAASKRNRATKPMC